MLMNIELFTSDTHPTTTWSGGTTTQLAIWPPDAQYEKRDFLWRISSARVEVEESLFTSLPGVQRILMPLDGQLILEHEGHYRVVLQPFMQDAFCGDWTTRSSGCVQDFNVMYKEPCQTKVEHLQLSAEVGEELSLKQKEQLFLYCCSGSVRVSDIELVAGDSALLHPDNKTESIALVCHHAADVIVVKIYRGE